MPSHDAFMKEIVANPEDLTPRLIYADWLDEQGDPRGEFIRVQCELATLDETDDRYPDLLLRERELLAEHRQEWLKPLKPYIRGGTFRCGFVERAKFRFKGLVDNAAHIAQMTPLRFVKLSASGIENRLSEFAELPILAQLKGIEVHDHFTGNSLLPIFGRCPPEFQLRRLALKEMSFTRTQLQRLFQLPMMQQIRHLQLERCGYQGAFDVMLNNPLPLTQLNLSGTVLYHDHVKALADSKSLNGLTSLHLDGCGLGNSGLEMIVNSSHLNELRHLELGFNNFERGAGAIFVDGLRGDQLISLSLSDFRFSLSNGELSELLLKLHALRRLHLPINDDHRRMINTLAAWPGLSNLTHLGLELSLPFRSEIELWHLLPSLIESPYWSKRTLLCLDRWNEGEWIRWLREKGMSEWENSVTASRVPIGPLHDSLRDV